MRCFLVWLCMTLWGRFRIPMVVYQRVDLKDQNYLPPKRTVIHAPKDASYWCPTQQLSTRSFTITIKQKGWSLLDPLAVKDSRPLGSATSPSIWSYRTHRFPKSLPLCSFGHRKKNTSNLEPKRQSGRPLGDIYQNICTTTALEIREEVVSLLSSTKRLVAPSSVQTGSDTNISCDKIYKYMDIDGIIPNRIQQVHCFTLPYIHSRNIINLQMADARFLLSTNKRWLNDVPNNKTCPVKPPPCPFLKTKACWCVFGNLSSTASSNVKPTKSRPH